MNDMKIEDFELLRIVREERSHMFEQLISHIEHEIRVLGEPVSLREDCRRYRDETFGMYWVLMCCKVLSSDDMTEMLNDLFAKYHPDNVMATIENRKGKAEKLHE